MNYSIKKYKVMNLFSNSLKYTAGMVILFVFLGLDAFAQDNAKVSRRAITLGAQNQKSIYGGFVDLKTGSVYNLSDVRPNHHTIDLIYAFGSSTGVNLMLPSSTGLNAFGASYRAQVYNGWEQKNRGTLIALEDNRENRRWFRAVKNNKQLLAAYDHALRSVNSRPGYTKTNHGPAARIRQLNIGDYFALRSRDRNVYAIGRITDVKEGYQGYVTLDMKIINQ